VVIAGQPLVQAFEGGLVQGAGTGRVSGYPAQQPQVAGAAVVVRVVRSVDSRIAGDSAIGQSERLVNLANRPLDVGQVDRCGEGIGVVQAQDALTLLVDALRRAIDRSMRLRSDQ